MNEIDQTAVFLAERPRLVRMAERILGDHAEAEDVVQNAWLRLDRNEVAIDNLPGWLTTVTTRLCLDRLRSRTPLPEAEIEPDDTVPDPADEVALADTVGIALQVVLDRLTPAERVAFVLHDTFGVEFGTIAQILDSSPAAARKLASRARAKVALPAAGSPASDADIVDAFLAAARGGDFARLMELLAPDAVIAGDELAVALGTPARIAGAKDVATMFNGAAQTAFPVYVEGRPGAAWLHRGEFKVAFDFTIAGGRVRRIDFRADPEVLATVERRK
ncbi:sigma-70 family RNA polymerase sigma factor [Flexivirga sp. ID2601S]|uniref:Sigma-70 family RNA polymerase sigma factor n=1 Tax=Flexivirga aerilata TaxID=1656889 RepID=A0A849AHS2_9MICO|nr:sigma-70 family RNA polymerase sigma factor [Flexivirga aerilata]NNG37980.1 sigma-70 family RNA polymerase sigma factor [Flexivirga aerilata]